MTPYNVAITVRRLTPYRLLRADDKADWGRPEVHDFAFETIATSDETARQKALDWFHDHYGIKCLDDFEIEAKAEVVPCP
jgi:hypothetical protein